MRTIRSAGFGLGSDNLSLGVGGVGGGAAGVVTRRGLRQKAQAQGTEDSIGSYALPPPPPPAAPPEKEKEPEPFDDAPTEEEKDAPALSASVSLMSEGGSKGGSDSGSRRGSPAADTAGKMHGGTDDGGGNDKTDAPARGEAEKEAEEKSIAEGKEVDAASSVSVSSSASRPRLKLPPVKMVDPQEAAEALATFNRAASISERDVQRDEPSERRKKKRSSLSEKKGKKRRSRSEGASEEGTDASRDEEQGPKTAALPVGNEDKRMTEAAHSMAPGVGHENAAVGVSKDDTPSKEKNAPNRNRAKGANGKKPPVRRVSSRSFSEDERRQRAGAVVGSRPEEVKSVTPSEPSRNSVGGGGGQPLPSPQDPVGAPLDVPVPPPAGAAAATAYTECPPAPPVPPPPPSGPPRMGPRLFTRMGLGVASKSSPRETATEAALRAVSDALDRTLPTLVGTSRTSPLTAIVRLGVPPLLSLPAAAESESASTAGAGASVNNVDLEALCRSVEERGLTLAAGGLDVVDGGLAVRLDSSPRGEDQEEVDDGAGSETGGASEGGGGPPPSHLPSTSSPACCCCVVASVTLGYASGGSRSSANGGRSKRRRTSRQSLMMGAGAQPLLLQHHDHRPVAAAPSADLLPGANDGAAAAIAAQEHLLLAARRADALAAENERLRRETEDRVAEIDLLRSRLALRDEALRLLGKESSERAQVGPGGGAGGGRGTGLRAAAAAMEGLRGLGSAAAAAAASQPQAQPALHHHAHSLGQQHPAVPPLPSAPPPPPPPPPLPDHTLQRRSSGLSHVAQAAAAVAPPGSGLPPPHPGSAAAELPLPHIQRVTDLLNQSQLPPPRPFNVGEHLGGHGHHHHHAQSPHSHSHSSAPAQEPHSVHSAHSASPVSSGGGGVPAPTAADIADGASALSTLGGAAALAAAAASRGPLPVPAATAPEAQQQPSTPSSAAATVAGVRGAAVGLDASEKSSSPSTAAAPASPSDPNGSMLILAGAGAGAELPLTAPSLPQQHPLAAQTPGYSYRKLKPGKTGKNNDRQFVKHNYTDYSDEVPPPEDDVLMGGGGGVYDNVSPGGSGGGSNKRGGVSKGQAPSFPFKLHFLLDDVARLGQDDIITWLPHGRCFRVLQQKEFVEHVMPRYFQLSKYSSFLRQLNLYGFHRFSAGPDKGAYYHELFLRGMPFLAKRMVRIRVNGNGIRSAGNPDTEPDFYAMPPVPVKDSPLQVSEQHQGHHLGGVVSAPGSGDVQQYIQHQEFVSTEYGGQFASA